ncbi:ROK family protein [Chelatococcus asaccharovorans]|uniref:ROK family protein n=1 Tax=Chelatococcus asaccharovorans TaxID=28210 RepID=A0A2V3UBV6_9HYPH|nr:ROK family protein [Chelatococcus asaccharovorans]MBS7703363.1 ROK family protein [Chelatococcus asaccharovorans]PXW61701.1 ROK family protein [Chelatococcus asaccharovorans]
MTNSANDPAKKPAKTLPKKPAKTLPESPAKTLSETPAKSPAKEPAKGPAKELAKEPARKPAPANKPTGKVRSGGGTDRNAPDTAEVPPPAVGVHGADVLPSVIVETYNAELRDDEGFVGDRAAKGAFTEILDNLRKTLREYGDDPLGEADTDAIKRSKLEAILAKGDSAAAALVMSAIEDYAQELTAVIRRFRRQKSWSSVERIVFGGGFRDSRVGELAIGRASVLLKQDGHGVELALIRNHPDEAGLIGAVHLAPSWMFAGHDSILAIDIGGTNIRAGVVHLKHKKDPDLGKASVWETEIWRHRDEKPTRREAVERLVGMVEGLIEKSVEAELVLAPFIGIGCPGEIAGDGCITKGAQNLPGNWEGSRFNLARELQQAIPVIGDHETAVLIHNDAVVQGLSEVPFMADVERWGILTIGTGLGNGVFVNRRKGDGTID